MKIPAWFIDITDRQWTPIMIRHFNRHDAHTETLADGARVSRIYDFNGEIFQIEQDGRVYRSDRFYAIPAEIVR